MTSPQCSRLDTAFNKALRLTFPPVLVQLLRALLEPEPSFSSIAGYLQMDPPLAGKVLHLVNSSHYGFARKFTDIEQAAVAIGTGDLFKLVISLSLVKKLSPKASRPEESLFSDWRLTIWSALAAEAIAKRLCPEKGREAYLAGMLKDLPLYFIRCREDIPDFLRRADPATIRGPMQFSEELALWGCTHPELARNIFLAWELPDDLAEAVRLHHDLAEASTRSPLTKCVIYGTRWAELLHGPDSDPGRLVAFELSLAAELGLDMKEMEVFRSSCAEAFNKLLAQLGIEQARPESRLHDQSLASIQSYYFLVLGVLGDIMPDESNNVALNLQQQLRLFWGVNVWELRIAMPDAPRLRVYACQEGTVSSKEYAADKAPPPSPLAVSIPLRSGERQFGELRLAALPGEEDRASLFMCAHMLSMCLENQYRRTSDSALRSSLASFPFPVARLNGDGHILEATASFLDVLDLKEAPRGMGVSDLFRDRLGITFKECDGAGGAGRFLSAPEGRFPGTPLYVSCRKTAADAGESFVLLGETDGMRPLQTLALAEPGFLQALMEGVRGQCCLLDAAGLVLWASGEAESLAGRNIFAISRPEEELRELWSPSFLNREMPRARVRAAVSLLGESVPFFMNFTCLENSGAPLFLLVLSPLDDNFAAAPELPAALSAAMRDPLTGLHGLAQFYPIFRQVTEFARRQRSVSGLLVCGLAELGRINAAHGRGRGDEAQRLVAKFLAGVCRPGKDLPCRFTGGSFIAIVTNASQALMDSMAEKLLSRARANLGKDARVYVGLTLIAPGSPPDAALDAVSRAAKQAAEGEDGLCWQ